MPDEKSSLTGEFKFFRLPKDLQVYTLNYLSTKDIAKNVSCASKDLSIVAKLCRPFKLIAKGQKILREAKGLPHSVKDVLSSENGLIALGEGLFTPGEVVQADPAGLRQVLCENGFRLLKTRYMDIVPLSQANPAKLESLLSDNMLILFSECRVTANALTTLDAARLQIVTSFNDFSALTAFREGLLSFEDIARVTIGQLKLLLSDNGLTALRNNIIKMNLLTYDMPLHQLRFILRTDNLQEAIERKQGFNRFNH